MTSYKDCARITSQTDGERYDITKKVLRARKQQKKQKPIFFDYINEEVPQRVFEDDIRRRNEGGFLKEFFEASPEELANFGNNYGEYRKTKLKELQQKYNEMYEEQIRVQVMQKKQQNNGNENNGEPTI